MINLCALGASVVNNYLSRLYAPVRQLIAKRLDLWYICARCNHTFDEKRGICHAAVAT